MNKKIFLFFVTFLSLFAFGQKKPNIIIIVADDLGWNDVGFHNTEIKTPNLDKIVQQGIELERFYVRPLCSPTRAGLLTGKYPERFGLRGVVNPRAQGGLPDSVQTLANLLAAAGYKNRGAFGKWHLGHSDIKFHPLKLGFTEFYGHYNGAIDYFTHFRNGALDWHEGFQLNYDKGYATDLIAGRAVEFISQSKNDPFFAYISFNAPHAPLQAKEDDLKLYGFDSSKIFEDFFGGGVQMNEYNTPDYGRQGRGNNARQTLSAMITSMDDGIGEIIGFLEKNDLLDNTLIWFLSDNGGALQFSASNFPLRGGKETEWEGGVRVASAVYWKGRWEGGKKNNQLMSFIDVFPTVAAIARAPMNNEIDGINISQALDGKKMKDRVLYLGKEAVVTNQWKLNQDELFDIQKDKSEKNNLASGHSKVLEELKTSLAEFKKMVVPNQLKFYPPEWKPKTWDIQRISENN
jgi:arylsulfatase B